MSRILFIDSYDSYSYNLYQLILDVIPDADIVIVRSDRLSQEILNDGIQSFDFIVIGPGPGDPRNAEDVGIIPSLFFHDVPILGVCLGFQMLCMYCGAKLERMKTVKHGQVSPLITQTSALYPEGGTIPVTRYHSIYADISLCDDLMEVAWVEDTQDNGRVSMSAMHRTKPFVAVQYHPESACSQGGPQLIRNFLRIACAWNDVHRPLRKPVPKSFRDLNIRPSPLWGQPSIDTRTRVKWREMNFVLAADRLAELMGVKGDEHFILLDAAAQPSRYSVVAALSGAEKHLRYHVGDDHVSFGKERTSLITSSIWQFIAEVMDQRKVEVGPMESPFWGGFVGYINYEAGVETLGIRAAASSAVPDINLIFVERSIVIDHKAGRMFVQSIRNAQMPSSETDSHWITQTCHDLSNALQTPPASPPSSNRKREIQIELPDKDVYLSNIKAAQQFLAEGQSYELCLTAKTRISCEPQAPWQLYQTLRRRNPSPFACFMRLPGMHLLSSSPERFLSWSREGLCQLRPIKGTVRKTDGMNFQKAESILSDPKEIAENLMIVDLIRHDLHQIANDVRTPSLMKVEEYETVYQLVSVITGQTKFPYTGLDVLSRALPPGSMTGAPKKRSVELLQRLEKQRRGIYSGVCGYLSVCGGGDWSVIIRSAFKYDHENSNDAESETWWIGAGGAITALSEPESEWEEMLTKLQSTLPCFA